MNLLNNWYRKSQDTPSGAAAFGQQNSHYRMWAAGNQWNTGSTTNILGTASGVTITPAAAVHIAETTAALAASNSSMRTNLLTHAGNLRSRDKVDMRSVTHQTGTNDSPAMVQSDIITLRDQANDIGFPDSDYEADGYPKVPITAGPPDTDEDGMADSWELSHFGDLKATSWQDADGDGWTNLEEYLNKTHPNIGGDPMDANSQPHVEGALTP
jgi:hypothetical protein